LIVIFCLTAYLIVVWRTLFNVSSGIRKEIWNTGVDW